jgi:hypothetical protein
MLASLYDEHNRISIPGFYKDVRDLSGEGRQNQHTLIVDEEEYARKIGVKAFWGEEGYTLTERMTVRPTLEIQGIQGGYTDEGIEPTIPLEPPLKSLSGWYPTNHPGMFPERSSIIWSPLHPLLLN